MLRLPLLLRHAGLVLALGLGLASGTAPAATSTFTSRAAFEAALGALSPGLTDFEGLASGTPFGGGVGYSLGVDAAGFAAAVQGQFWTSSGTQSLGLEDAGGGQFLNGDRLSFSLAPGVRAFGLQVIGGSDLANATFDDVFVRMSDGLVTVDSSKTPELGDGAGSFAFFLGLVSDSDLGTVSLEGFSPGALLYAVDDITLGFTQAPPVPEPGRVALMAGGGLLLLGWQLRRRRPGLAPAPSRLPR